MSGELPFALRFRKFRHCLEWYCFLTRQGFQETYLRLGREFGFDELHQPDESQLARAAALLNQERANFLRKLEAFDGLRAEEKARGRRQPRRSQLEELYTPDWLEAGAGQRP